MIINNEFEIVETQDNGNSIWAEVYDITLQPDGTILYMNDGESTENIEEANHLYTVYVCWRGVWDNRVYFPNDNEYYISDILDSLKYVEEYLKIRVLGNGFGELD